MLMRPSPALSATAALVRETGIGIHNSPGNADLSDEAAGVSNDGAKSENADIAASAGNGKRRTLSYLHRLAGRYLMY
jgi:hypothetical protein